ncbi:Uu.00g068440.m01.CDS01 [Anthostomella pinea]|uniref:Uu.00g068440.m01.CDS01 n=1 Tax=Anthostomella pinea TaxID=933095 RepID=A0AAI8VV47_9PEZI|nr:Uu.00g068440.m01.CDS01 [Anthostomella pinea]
MADSTDTPPSISAHDGITGYSNGAAGASHRSVKRPRPVKSCLECRRRKLKCDRLLPCTQCQKSQRTCRYAADGDVASTSDGSDVETPERAPKRNCTLTTGQGPGYRASPVPPHASASMLDDHSLRIERLEKLLLGNTPSVTAGSGSTSTRQSRPIASALTIRGLTVKGGLRTRFFGQSSTRVLVNLFDEAKEFMFSSDNSSEIREKFMTIQKIHKALQEEHSKVTAPITVYVDSMTPIQKRMADVLPSRPVCDQLLQIYLNGSESLYRVLHIPSFMSQYNLYWQGNPQSDAFLPQLLSILCVGYRFIGIGKGQYQNDREGIHMPTACALVRAWLDGLRGKQLVEFSTLQAEILQMMAQRMIRTQNQDSWTQLGLIVRMAMTMGLHRDPGEFAHKILPFWAEQRRKVWYTILEFDVHMSMQCNLPSCIREGDFTCLPPRNLNDEDLHPTVVELPPPKPIEQDTDSRIQVFAASTLASRFKVLDLINRIDSLDDYQQVVDLGSELERVLDDIKYVVPREHTNDMKEIRRQWMTRVVLDMNCRRPLLALYRPFALSCPDAPQQIMTGYLRSAIMLLSYLDDLDPGAPGYEQFWHMHHLVLKQDILQATFGICYYIKQANNRSSSHSSTWGSNTRSVSVEEACAIASESSILLSLPRLKGAVEKVLETMITRIKEIGTDMKDLISLMVVFHTYQGGNLEQRKEAINQGMQSILDAGFQALHTNRENIASMPLMPTPVPLPMNAFQTNASMMNMQPFMMTPDVPNILPDDLGIWDMEFWNPFTVQPGPT